MQDFKKLRVWQKAHQNTLAVYELTKTFPREERYGLSAQLRRCAMSVPSNIAEGAGRGSNADFARFLHIARGSASEMEYQILLAHDLGFFDRTNYQALNSNVVEVKRMLSGLINKLITQN